MFPSKLSHYRIIEKIGVGGMGVVRRAHDEQLERDVAIKVFPAGLLSDEKARQRFRKEALALARFNHPNIGAVYEFGSDAGVDFLVMELISGVTLDVKLSSGPLPEKEVLRLGAQLADGLAAAHSQGIIHRDLKPGNLRLTTDGRLKILDFGIAQLAEPADPAAVTLTLTRNDPDMSGTLPYMAPEQLRGQKADARSDIYACGAVLYEMVTGKRPFPGVSGPQLVGAILEQEPSRPTTANRSVSPALESIILKALDKDPERRYQSARELNIDLERLSSGTVPMAAKARRPWGLVAVLAGALAIGILLAYMVAWRHRAQSQRTTTISAPAGRSRKSVAVLGFKNLSGRADEAWISTAVAEMLTTELAAGEQVRTVPGENVSRMKMDLSLADADSFAPDTLQKIHKNLGTDLVVVGSYLALGNEGGGKVRLDFRLQDAIAGQTIVSFSETATEGGLIDLVSRTGADLRQKMGIGGVPAADEPGVRAALPSNPESARLYSEGLDKLRVFDALAARDLLSQSIAIEPNHALTHSALARAWSSLGYDTNAREEAKKAFDLSSGLSREERLWVEGQYREAVHDWKAAMEIYRTLAGFFPDNVDYALQLASAQVTAGMPQDALATLVELAKMANGDARVDVERSRAANALGDFNQGQQAAESAVTKGRTQGSRLVVAQARSTEGRALERLGKLDDAAAAFAEAQSLFTAAGDRGGAAAALNSNGIVLYDRGDFEGAKKMFGDALPVFRKLGAEQRVSSALNNLGNVNYDQGDLPQARKYYEQSLEICRKVEDKGCVAGALGNLANVLDSMGDLKSALSMQQQGLAAFREVKDNRGVGSTLGNFGNLLAEMGDLAGAESKYQEAAEIQTANGYQRGIAYSYYGLSDVRTAQGRFEEARSYAEKAAAIRRESKEQGTLAASQLQLAFIMLQEGNATEAEPLARAGAEEFDREKSADQGASAYGILAMIQAARNEVAEAQQSAKRAISLSQKTAYKPPKFDAMLGYASAQAAGGNTAEAVRTLENVRSDAAKYGYVPYDFESRLTMGEIEMKAGLKAAARARLTQLEKESRAQGYLRVAEKAKNAE